MQVPAILYGPYREVAQRCKKVLRRYEHGASWWELLEADGMLETAKYSGLMVIGDKFSNIRSQPHYRCYVPWEILAEYYRVPPIADLELVGSAASQLFASGLERTWALVGLLGSDTVHTWLRPGQPERDMSFLRAMVVAWQVLGAEGARYSEGSSGGTPFWQLLTSVAAVLIRHGLPGAFLRTGRLPESDIHSYLRGIADQPDLHLSPELQALVRDLDRIPTLPTQARSGPFVQTYSVIDGGSSETQAEPDFMSPALLAALQADDPRAAQRLIESGENPMAVDPEDYSTPMSWAVLRGHTELVCTLLDHGADIEDRFDEGESPLMMAAYGGYRTMVDLLLERGADPTYVSEKGWDAADFAELGKHDEIAAILREARRTYPRGSAADESEDWPDDATDEA